MEIKTHIDLRFLTPIRKEKPNWSDEGKEWDVYKIKISELHYNEENGRIATWISTYTSEKDNPPLSTFSREKYNDIIESFIKRANTAESFRNLMNDLRKKTQLNPGVILDDGTIVSGNRRFTALRNLYRETYDEKFEYFECFVIPAPTTRSQVEFIKLIETKTQFGVVTEEDYNPIDRLVTIYKYLIDEETKIWSIKEYAKKIGIKESEAENLFDRAWIMEDYLEFIQKPKAFHIAREKKLDGPIADLAPLFKKLKTSQMSEWHRIKPLFYSEMSRGSGDRTREVRKVKKIYQNNPAEFNILLAELYSKQSKVEEQEQYKKKMGLKTSEEEQITQIVTVDTMKITKALNATQKVAAREKQIKLAEKAYEDLGNIETDVFSHMDVDEVKKLNRVLDTISSKIDALKRKLNK